MKLRTKSTLVLGAATVLSVALNFGVLTYLVFPSFVDLERQEATKNAERVLEAFESELAAVAATTGDWSQWDESHGYVQSRDKNWEANNLYLDGFKNIKMNIVYYYDRNGSVVYGKVFDFPNNKQVTVKDFVLDGLEKSHHLLRHADQGSIHKRIILTSAGPAFIASRPILKNEGKGDIAGTLIMGRLLDKSAVEALRTQTRVTFDLWPFESDALHDAERAAAGRLSTSKQKFLMVDTADDTASAYALLRDTAGAPILLIRSDTPKHITAIGADTLRVSLIGVMFAGLLALIVVAVLMRRMITGPLSLFTDHVLATGASGDMSRRLDISRDDEIAALGGEFNAMLGRLADARTQLLEQSFQSGVAEMAAGVLHNVRNQLNPLVLRLGRLRQLFAGNAADNVEAAFEQLAAADTPAERRAKLVEYLKLSTRNLMTQRGDMHAELDAISGQLARVEEVVAEQDRFSHANRVIEPIKLADVVRRATGMIPDDVGKGIEVVVDPALEDFGAVKAETFVLTHVIQNLLMNAVDSIEHDATDSGRIEISAKVEPSSTGTDQAVLIIRDNGRGIAPDTLDKIFERGFTTKAGTKRGNGLHWCANSLSSMSGRIFAENPVSETGAVFYVVLPLAAAGSLVSAA